MREILRLFHSSLTTMTNRVRRDHFFFDSSRGMSLLSRRPIRMSLPQCAASINTLLSIPGWLYLILSSAIVVSRYGGVAGDLRVSATFGIRRIIEHIAQVHAATSSIRLVLVCVSVLAVVRGYEVT